MKNKKITRKISQGMYVLTTTNGGCVVDAVSQVSAGDQPLISVAVMKSNFTNEALKQNQRFALSVLGMDVDPELIKRFGLNSMRNMNKFEGAELDMVEGVPVVKGSLGYMVCEIVDVIDTGTHDLFIGRMIEGDVFSGGEAMTYGYYQEHKEELLKVTTKKGKTAWVCTICGYVAYTEEGEELPADYKCPVCTMGREYFEKKAE